MKRSLWLPVLLVAVAGGAVAAAGNATPAPKTSAANARVHVDSVPTSIPRTGVDVNNGQFFLDPLRLLGWSAQKSGFISSGDAIRRARATQGAKGVAEAVLAAVTVPGMAIENAPAWIVTFRFPQPVNVSSIGTYMAQHAVVVLYAVTGRFMVGTFTKK